MRSTFQVCNTDCFSKGKKVLRLNIYFSDDFPSGFSSLSEENHANMTYSEIEDATLRSMSSTPWNNNNYQVNISYHH